MSIIRGYAETIQEEGDGDTADYAAIIQEESDQLLTTVDKEREITRILSDPSRVEPVDVPTVLDSVIPEIRERYPDAKVDVECPDTAEVRATSHLRTAVYELLTNAIIHSDQDQPAVQLSVSRSDETIAISVADDGPGIPEVE